MRVDLPLDVYAEIGKRLPFADHYRFLQLPDLVRNRAEYCDRISNSHPVAAKIFHPATTDDEKEVLSAAFFASRPMHALSARKSDVHRLSLTRLESQNFHALLSNPQIFRYLAEHAGQDSRIWQMLCASWTRRTYWAAKNELAPIQPALAPQQRADLTRIAKRVSELTFLDEEERCEEVSTAMRDSQPVAGAKAVERLALTRELVRKPSMPGWFDDESDAEPELDAAHAYNVLRKHVEASRGVAGESLLALREINRFAKDNEAFCSTFNERLAVHSRIAVRAGDDYLLRDAMLRKMQTEIRGNPDKLTHLGVKLYFAAVKTVPRVVDRLPWIKCIEAVLPEIESSQSCSAAFIQHIKVQLDTLDLMAEAEARRSASLKVQLETLDRMAEAEAQRSALLLEAKDS